ncbi:hypothetical protein WICPIJ_007156 [Wickerhamomyces pijperi]|uniref:Uncharacterized protein n=1 Tax=Wickerhamomyces pijperi TaxID=599730 RepID=A0A9P8Q240_WICPI|nr:hypothetical protein WICPIJ_007156 [Wickerhamomyces pijperi]
MTSSTEEDFTPLPPLDLISQITTFKFFQDSVKSVYQTTATQLSLQIVISQISTSQVAYAWRQQRSNRTGDGEIEKVSKIKAEQVQNISKAFIDNAQLLGTDSANLIRVNYDGNTKELFILPDFSNDLAIVLIIGK